jgi:hypothetical protein
MKNAGFPNTRVSPCLKIFIASLLEGADSELVHDALFLADEPLAINTALSSSALRASDENYN